MSTQINNSIQVVISALLSILILVTFIYAYTHNTSQDVSTFSNCIDNKSCALKLALLSNSSDICLKSSNVSSCVTQYVLKSRDVGACNYFNNSFKLSCIISLSVQEKTNYCNSLYSFNTSNSEYIENNSTIEDKGNIRENQTLKKYFVRCDKSYEYYMNETS